MNANLQQDPAPGAGTQAYLSDLEALRNRAREQMMKGAVTPSFPETDRLYHRWNRGRLRGA